MKLTKKAIEALEPRKVEYFVWDGELRGFGIRVLPSGRRSFVLQYRINRRSRRMNLGSFGVTPPDAARCRALKELAKVQAGEDPMDEREARRRAISVDDFASIFDDHHIKMNSRLKASTAREYRHALRRYILPALGKLMVAEVTRADVEQLHRSMHDKPYQANRTLEVVSKMFNIAEEFGHRPDGSNPRKRVKKYPEQRRERFLSPAELKRVGEVLAEMEAERVEMPSAIAAVRLLMLTGCRLNEILTLRWADVRLGAGELRLPGSKTGKRVVQVGAAAIEVFRNIERIEGNPWVIRGKLEGARLTDLQPFWRRVRARTGLKDVRIHDLRHTFASVAAGAGMSLPMIGRLLGHTQVQTTARYAHLAAGTVKDAANDVATVIANRMAPIEMRNGSKAPIADIPVRFTCQALGFARDR